MLTPWVSVRVGTLRYLLREHTEGDHVVASVRLNQTKTGEEIGVSKATIRKYKNAFSDMTSEERALVLDAVTAGRRAERNAVSERSEGGEQRT